MKEKNSHDDARYDDGIDDGPLLRRADMAQALCRYLLRGNGLLGYRKLVAEYDELARDVVFATLARMAVSGADPSSITSWGYFLGPIADEQRLRHLEANSIRPGDVFNMHRPSQRWQRDEEPQPAGPLEDWPPVDNEIL